MTIDTHILMMAGWWVLSAAVGALEEPTPMMPKWYGFVYRFLHLLSANLPQAGLIRRKSS